MLAIRKTLILIAALGLVGCKHSPKNEQSAVVPAASTSAGASAALVQRDARMYGWKLGEQYRYRLEMNSRVALDARSVLSDFEVKGAVVVTPLQVGEEAVSFLVSFESVKAVSHVPGTQSTFDDMTKELKERYLFTMSGGLVSESYFPSDTSPIVSGVFRTVSSSLQFARSLKAAERFESAEYDTTGQYIAEYTPLAGRGVWQKRKRKYLGILMPKGVASAEFGVVPQIVVSQTDVVLSESGRPTTINVLEEVELKGAQAPLRGKNTLLLANVEVSHIAGMLPGWEESRKGMVRLAVNEPYDSHVSQDALDNAKINGATFTDIIRRLEQVARRNRPETQGVKGGSASADRKMSDEDTRTFIALSTILRRQPETVSKALAKIVSKSPATETLVDGLGSAGSVEAQSALAKIATDKKADSRLRARALIALSRVERPYPESINCLTALLGDSDFGTQARYGLGTYCRLLRESGDTKRAAEVGNLLIRQLEGSKSESKISTSLRALANAGHAPACDIVLPYLSDQRVQVRVDAVRSLRLIDTPAAERAIAKTLVGDATMLVQLAAIESMEERRPSDVLSDALRQATSDDDAHVRYRAVELMVRWLVARPDLRQSIEVVAKNDREPKVRELAAGAL